LLLGSVGGEVNDRQKTDTTLGAERGGKRSGPSDVLADEGAAGLIETQTAKLFGNVGANETEFSRLNHELARQFPIVLLELVNARHYFLIDKLPRRVGDHAMLFGEVFRREDLLRRPLLDQERATFEKLFLFGYG